MEQSEYTGTASLAAELTSWMSVETLDGVGSVSRPALSSPLPERLGDYLVERVLGVGGMGVVYQASTGEAGPPVAVKTLHGMSPQALYRFKQEFRRTASLTHPHLAQLYELGADGETWYYSMELVLGPHLLERVWGGPSFPGGRSASRALLDLLPALLDALTFLHASDVLHLDIKPSNIRFSRAGVLKLLDFGLSQAANAEHLPGSGGFSGTPAYMAPEQVLGEFNAASDCYALGVTLFEAVTGRLPHLGPPLSMLLAKRDGAPSVAQLTSEVPDALARAIDGLLHPDPRSRTTLAELRETLALDPPSHHSLPAPSVPRLLGRDGELERLALLVPSARDGSVLLRIVGASGVGKSALLQAAAGLWIQAGALVLSSRCFQWQAIAFKAVDEIVDQLYGQARRLQERGAELPADLPLAQAMFPVLGGLAFDVIPPRPVNPVAEKERGLRALSALVRQIAESQLVVLCVDDAHWGDSESGEFLAALLADNPRGLLVVLGSRPTERPPFAEQLGPLGANAARQELELTPLSPPEGIALARAAAPGRAWTPGELQRLVQETEGLPILIERVARFSSSTPDRPLTLRDVVQHQLQGLSEEVRRIALTAVLTRSPTSLAAIQAACSSTGIKVALAELQAARLLRSESCGQDVLVEPYHDRLRLAILADADPAFVRAQCARLAEQLDQRGIVPGQSAELWAEAGQFGLAADRALQAAHEATRALAFGLAVDFYQRAFSWSAEARDRPGVAEAHGWALYRAGRCLEAAEVFQEAAQLHTGQRRWALLSHAIEALLISGQVNQGSAILATLLSEIDVPQLSRSPRALLQLAMLLLRARRKIRSRRLRGSGPVNAKARLKAEICWDCGKTLVTLSPTDGALLLLRSLLYAFDSRDEFLIARGLTLLASGFLPFFDDKHETIIEWVASVATKQADPYLSGMLSLTRAVSAHMSGRWKEVLGELQLAESQLGKSTLVTNFEHSLIATSCLVTLSRLGRLDHLKQHCIRIAQAARARGDRVAYVANISNLTYCHLAANNRQQVEDLIEEHRQIIASWSAGYGMWHSSFWLLRAGHQLRQGWTETAHRELVEEWPKIKGAALHLTRASAIEVLETRAAVLLARAPEGALSRRWRRREVERIVRRLETIGRSDGPPYAACLRAALHFEQGDLSGAIQQLERGAHLYDSADMAERACMARWQLARLRGDPNNEQLETERAQRLGVRDLPTWAPVRMPGFEPWTFQPPPHRLR